MMHVVVVVVTPCDVVGGVVFWVIDFYRRIGGMWGLLEGGTSFFSFKSLMTQDGPLIPHGQSTWHSSQKVGY